MRLGDFSVIILAAILKFLKIRVQFPSEIRENL
jgi:hypothetical protein